MGMVRVTIHANEAKKELNRILKRKSVALTTNPVLAKQVADVYGQIVTPYVPKSDKNVPHHLNQYYATSDAHVIWTRKNSSGEDIAKDLYYGPIRGKWHKRGSDHKPRSEWAEAMHQKGNWNKYIQRIKPLVKEAIKNG